MENNKDIGKVFREKLKDLDQSPDSKVWDAINADLQKKKKRRSLPFWFTTIGIVLVVGSFYYFIENRNDRPMERIPTQHQTRAIGSTSENISENDESNQEINNTSNTKNVTDSIKLKTRKTVETELAPNSKNNQVPMLINGKTQLTTVVSTSDYKQKTRTEKQLFAKKDKTLKNNYAVLKTKNDGRKNNSKTADLNTKAIGSITNESIAAQLKNQKAQTTLSEIPDLQKSGDTSNVQNTTLAEPEVKNDSLKTTVKKLPIKPAARDSVPSKLQSELQRMRIFVYGSPTFSGYLSAKSPLDKDLDNNPKSVAIAISYGGYAIYDFTNQWSMRFGIGIENLKFTTNDATVNTSNYASIEYAQGISNATIYSQSGNATKMAITQHISYTEIPLEFKYVIKNGEIGINTYGGLSYRFLGKNEVSVKTANGATFDLGKTANLARNAFAVHFGVGFDYKFSKKIRLNIEPIFKYHFLDYKNARATPYSFGILTGLQFSLQ